MLKQYHKICCTLVTNILTLGLFLPLIILVITVDLRSFYCDHGKNRSKSVIFLSHIRMNGLRPDTTLQMWGTHMTLSTTFAYVSNSCKRTSSQLIPKISACFLPQPKVMQSSFTGRSKFSVSACGCLYMVAWHTVYAHGVPLLCPVTLR